MNKFLKHFGILWDEKREKSQTFQKISLKKYFDDTTSSVCYGFFSVPSSSGIVFCCCFRNGGSGLPTNLSVYLPLPVSKFFQPVVFNSGDFFTKWKFLSQPSQECQKIFAAKFPPINTVTDHSKVSTWPLATQRDH